jgi:hypothetical protein
LGGPAVDIKATVTSPSHCAKGLDTTINIGGDYTGELTEKELWILVYPTDAKYYPQTMNACRQFSVDASAGKWNTVVNFGGPPQQYDLVAVITEADGLASREFKAWLQGGCATQHFPGYSPNYLPGGLTEMAAITVSTQ